MTDRSPAPRRILRAAAGDRVRTAFPLAPLTIVPPRRAGRAVPRAGVGRRPRGRRRSVVATGVPFVVIGKGSNVLVADARVPRTGAAARARLPVGRPRRRRF